MAPNLKALAQYSDVKGRLHDMTAAWDAKKKEAKEASDDFDAKKTERAELFLTAFEHVSKSIDGRKFATLSHVGNFVIPLTLTNFIISMILLILNERYK
jgi:chromosome segregation ATPase